METRLPDHGTGQRGYSSLFVAGWRRSPATGQIEQTGTLIVKRAYTIDRWAGALEPAQDPQRLFMADEPDEPAGAGAPGQALPRYEHDLASFKPEADVVVLDYVASAGTPARVVVGGQIWLARTLGEGERHLFGWSPRAEGPRHNQAGTFTDQPTLPADFKNAFFCGYRRDARTAPAPPALPPGTRVVVERGAAPGYGFTLRDDVGRAAFYTYAGAGPDREGQWRRHELPMVLDTLVVEPERDRCALVWRGVWPFGAYPEASYRLLVVEVAA